MKPRTRRGATHSLEEELRFSRGELRIIVYHHHSRPTQKIRTTRKSRGMKKRKESNRVTE
jgi:hypothetical protein